jgi:hypothetical protein
MKKNLSILLANVTESGIFSCDARTDNEQNDAYPDVKQENDTTYIRAGLWPVTYSIAPEMKHLKSVAFFIETPQGKFYKFLSTEPLKSKHGFEELTKIGNYYTGAIFKLKTKQEGHNKITVIGNYYENDLTNDLKSAKSMEDILKIKTRASLLGKCDPHLMFDHKIIDIESEEI